MGAKYKSHTSRSSVLNVQGIRIRRMVPLVPSLSVIPTDVMTQMHEPIIYAFSALRGASQKYLALGEGNSFKLTLVMGRFCPLRSE